MHDRHGHPLAVGDRVVIEGVVSLCWDGTQNDYCNISVATDVPMAGNPYTVTLNAKQVTKVGPSPDVTRCV